MNIISLNRSCQVAARVHYRQSIRPERVTLNTCHITQRDFSCVDRLMAEVYRCLSKRLIIALLLLLAAFTLSAYRHFTG